MKRKRFSEDQIIGIQLIEPVRFRHPSESANHT